MDIFDVLVIGRSCLDYIAVVQQFPAENQKGPLEFRLTEGGGQGGTASCWFFRLPDATLPFAARDRGA